MQRKSRNEKRDWVRSQMNTAFKGIKERIKDPGVKIIRKADEKLREREYREGGQQHR